MTADAIDKDINVLLLVHPRDIDEKTEFALDQFVLRGGKLIAFVDPYAYFDQAPGPIPGMPGMASSSTLPRLFKAWGVEMEPKVISDVVFASGGGQRYTPTVLSLNRTAFARDDVVMAQIETLLYAFGGAFNVKPAEGLSASALISSSANSMLVDTAQATVDTTMELARRLGKEPVLIHREIPGFVANRLMGALQKEALALAAAGIASKEDIDTTARSALGHPMGPFELMDMVGLDVIDFIAQATYDQTGDEADRPDPQVAALVAEGKLGRKTGQGWYSY